MFPCEISEILKNTYFEENMWMTASEYNQPDGFLKITTLIKKTRILGEL